MSPKRLTLTSQDNGKRFVLHPGDEILIHLSEQVGGGYEWTVDQLDTTVLAVLATRTDPAPDAAPGAAATRTFVLQAKATGTGRIELKHWRSWTGDTSIIERFAAQAEVRPESS